MGWVESFKKNKKKSREVRPRWSAPPPGGGGGATGQRGNGAYGRCDSLRPPQGMPATVLFLHFFPEKDEGREAYLRRISGRLPLTPYTLRIARA